MAKHLAGWMSPWQTGLLSGISDWGATMDKFNLINAQNQGRIQAYQAKYGAMQSTQALKMQNDALMKRIQMDQKQRSYTVNQTGADGKPYTVSYVNTFNPDSGTYEPKEVGRVPMKDPAQLQADREQAISDRQAMQLGAMQDRADTRQAAIDSRLDKRDADAQAKQAAAEQSNKADKLDARVEKDMDKFDQADPTQQAAMLKAAGLPAKASDTHIFGGNTPNSDDEAANRAAYEAAITAKHAKTMGIKPTADASSAAATNSGDASTAPAVTPNGQPILKKDGQLYVRDKNGKPVPYTPDASGNAQGVPLAMDDQSDAASPTAAPSGDDSEESDDGDNQQGLLASNAEPDESEMGSPESDQEDEEDDAQQDQQTQGLLA